MKRLCAVLAAVLALLVSAGYAAAEPPGGTAGQAAGQAAGSGQAAAALSGASQLKPTNSNISVRVLSPGDNGDVKQSNTVSSSSTAANANVTDQSADQKQDGSCGCAGGEQAIGQEAKNDQAASALSLATQKGASNANTSVRVLSPGDNGSVSQSNSVDSDATAANLNGTKQDADQDQGGGGTQAIGQEAKNDQAAEAASLAKQLGATNTNVSVRVLSPGDDGRVSQSNSVDSDATAANLNGTKQDADQDQGGGKECCHGATGTQAVGQESRSDQAAGAISAAEQKGASNSNIVVRVFSPGDNGSVKQSNSVDSDAKAANLNLTKQDADQDQGGGAKKEAAKEADGCCAGGGTQAVGQEAKNDQDAFALSEATQKGASNSNTPVRVDSPGSNGRVSQSNSVDSDATALNLNGTKQDADQDQGGGDARKSDGCCSGGGTQAVGQEAKNDQSAKAVSKALQLGASNSNTPVAVDSGGKGHGSNDSAPKPVDSKGHDRKKDGGSVEQSNSVDSDATAKNLNGTKQDADQDGGSGTQAIGQEAKNEQSAFGLSEAVQIGASNKNTPTAVDSKGHGGGSVKQSNSVDSDAEAANLNLTSQDADQDQGGGHAAKKEQEHENDHCCSGGGTQAVGQEAKNDQSAKAASKALQLGASNRNTPVTVDSGGKGHGSNGPVPVAVDSKGHDGKKGGDPVEQSNSVDSDATAFNLNGTKQDADQDQGGGSGLQAIGQEAKNDQTAIGLSGALQLGASNSNKPTAVDSKGHGGGSVKQSNSVDSDATAANLNGTKQDADQDQGGRGKECGCHDSDDIQAIGQSSKSEQGALAGSLAIQVFGHGKCGCSSGGNANTPVAVDSKGHGGSVKQSNSVDSDATAANLNGTKQDADQDQGGRGKECGCHDSNGIQAIGQESKSRQHAIGLSAALQVGASNRNTPVAVDSKARGGRVSQSNDVDSDADAWNRNATKQDADQDQGGSGIQAIGQHSYSAQAGHAFSLAAQLRARSSNGGAHP